MGAWTADSPEGEPAAILLAGDGTLEIRDVPRALITARLVDLPLDWSDLVSTTGSWYISEYRSAGYSILMMSLNSNDVQYYNGTLVEVQVDTRSDPVKLFLWYGDVEEAERFYFIADPGAQ